MTDANSKKPKGKAAKPKKIAYAGKEPTGDFHYETMNITLPNDDEIKAFKYEQNFSDEQMNDLLILLNHIYLDLDIFNKNQITENDRQAAVKAIFEIAQQVHKLKSTIDKHINILGQILPMNVMECIGESLDLSFSNAVLVDNNAYIRLNRDLNHIKQETVKIGRAHV